MHCTLRTWLNDTVDKKSSLGYDKQRCTINIYFVLSVWMSFSLFFFFKARRRFSGFALGMNFDCHWARRIRSNFFFFFKVDSFWRIYKQWSWEQKPKGEKQCENWRWGFPPYMVVTRRSPQHLIIIDLWFRTAKCFIELDGQGSSILMTPTTWAMNQQLIPLCLQ